MIHKYAPAVPSQINKAYLFLALILLISQFGFAQKQEIEQVFYFTGNTELQTGNPTQSVLQAINAMSKSDKNATFVALGNITKDGYPPKKSDQKKTEELLEKSIMQPLSDFNGNVIFMPGENEWNKNGHENIDDMESFIQDHSKVKFWPNDGCPREIEDLGMKNTELLMIDSQWFLEDWDDHLYLNNKCDIKTRDDFFAKFKDDLKDEQNKTVIVAVYHSVSSNSKQSFIESIGGTSKEDFHSNEREKLGGTLETLAGMFPDVIFVSASDRNLQYLTHHDVPQIISGAASAKLDKVRNTKDDEFAAKTNGFARLTVYKNRSTKVEFFETGKGETKKLFEKVIRSEQTQPKDVTYPDISNLGPTFKTSIYTKEETNKSGFYRMLWGNHYRDLYSREVEVPVLDLSKLPGNLRAISEGGGNQSHSLRLIDDEEHEYTAREIRKSAVRFIQSKIKDHYVEDFMQNTIAEDIVQDFYTTAQPYAPFALNPIFDSLDIYNAQPKLYYLPKQKQLGIYNEDYGDKLYMFEAHAGDENKDFSRFGNADDIISTKDLLAETRDSKKNQVDEPTYLKIRLMDFIVGDYDRHYDQWRWAEYEKEDGNKSYKAIRRDRDQAFPKYDGLVLSILKMGMIDFRSMEKYDDDVDNVKWMSRYAYPLDQAFLKEITWADWEKQVQFIQENLTDETIDKAFATLPEAAQDESIVNIKRSLKGRRDNLKSIAKRYYDYLMSHQIITGTGEKDDFLITRQPDGKTTVRLTTSEDVIFERTYDQSLTKEIWIYGLDDDDTFKIIGTGDHYIPLKILGGENNDIYDFENTKRAKVYDYKSKKNTFTNSVTRKWLVDSYTINNYNDASRKLNANTLFPSIGFDPDAGFKVGVKDTYTTYGLANNPFSTQQSITAQFYSATNGFELIYQGEFAHVFYNWNFALDARYTSPNYAINYFGTGNDTFYDDDAVDRDFNRVRIKQWSVFPSLKYRKDNVTISLGAGIESLNVEYDINGVTGINIPPVNLNPTDDVFDNQTYAGAEASFQYKNKAGEIAFIRRGYQFDLVAGYKSNIDEYNNEFTYLKPTLSVDIPLHPSGMAVLATKVGAHMNFGDNYEFYHGATLGGNQSLRGFRNERFNGQTSFYQSTDLRVGLSEIKTNFIPLRIGVSAGFDYGRVWTENDNSDQWHNSYGGSVFINGFKALTANVGYYLSDESNRLVFTLGFAF
ncbi:ShlB/FhaC/HecB family hemolysin secretion/activation protein [Leeuwenhoekiella sp. MAR_2009_132]|uniref:ShlB/FhaC/HecB family hemolysin secretion/activation protein n=1 Tax=Leeuwenhoekiella sp. MAR_2009_132 TaxID=1392489 RepID=UPI00048F876C|nr:ShlB/FhaC/HecB family hemolysin secretion/activation protein [Leeuwenhoekiella sp. MAR_2009_132]